MVQGTAKYDMIDYDIATSMTFGYYKLQNRSMFVGDESGTVHVTKPSLAPFQAPEDREPGRQLSLTAEYLDQAGPTAFADSCKQCGLLNKAQQLWHDVIDIWFDQDEVNTIAEVHIQLEHVGTKNGGLLKTNFNTAPCREAVERTRRQDPYPVWRQDQIQHLADLA